MSKEGGWFAVTLRAPPPPLQPHCLEGGDEKHSHFDTPSCTLYKTAATSINNCWIKVYSERFESSHETTNLIDDSFRSLEE